MSNNDFADTWAPTWVVQETIPGARKHVIENTARTFRSGRSVVEAVFFDQNRKEVGRRDGMVLKSKKGNEYCVCRRAPNTSGIAVTETSSRVGEIFDDI